ncbi:MAG TPA: FKBP-type peptidyl-prolyl cis-trans isomerase [Anaeromyxobacteraceae bacterium]|nr:FKBP-type peptidyl-prolyl cis-trans isomerase [Anaeromyxobacteraceae bacterium]
MRDPHGRLRIFTGLLLVALALATPLVPLGGEAPAAGDLRLSFKLDPRLMGGTYGGDRWVAGPTYAGTNGQDAVDVRAEVLDAAGKVMAAEPEWTASAPEVAAVSPRRGGQVRLTVKRVGEAKVTVAARGLARELVVRSKTVNGVIQLELALAPAAAPAVRSPGPPAKRPDTAAPSGRASALEGRRERLGYAVGVNLARGLKARSVEVDEQSLLRGIEDAFAGGEPLLTAAEVQTVLAEARRELGAKRGASAGATRRAAADENRREGEAFLARNGAAHGIVTLPSGLQYEVLKAGAGRRPSAADTVVCHYRGALLDGTEFDNTRARSEPAILPLRGAIRGVAEALQLMPVGSTWRIFVPSRLAYGERGLRGRKGLGARVPPNATLVYEVDLLSIRAAPEGGAAAVSGLAATSRSVP